MLLSVKNLSLNIEDEVLKDINLEIFESEIVSIIGPNGSGKSSLLRSIMQLEDEARGDLLLHEKPIKTLSSAELAKYRSYAPQQMSWDFEYTVFEFISMARIHHNNSIESFPMTKVLEDFNLELVKDKSIFQLSGGERQRVLLASTIYQGADLMILDEAYSSLDYKFRSSISELMIDFSKKHRRSVLQVTHDFNFALQKSDRILILNRGGISFCGKPKNIIEDRILDEVFKTRFEYLKNDQELDWIKC